MIRVGVVAESPADGRDVQRLLCLVARSRVSWMEAGTEQHAFEWCSVSGEILVLRHAPTLARDRRHLVAGHFRGLPGDVDALSYRAALLLFDAMDPKPDLLVFLRDLDGDVRRRRGAEQALAERSWRFRVVSGFAEPEREAWVISAFTPRDAGERDAVAALRQELGFDPLQKSERLSSTVKDSPRDAKRVLKALLSVRRDHAETWTDADLEVLRRNGGANGLERFLDDLERELVALFDPSQRPRS